MGVEAPGKPEERVKGMRRGPRTEPYGKKNRIPRKTQKKWPVMGRKPGRIYRNPVEERNFEGVIISVKCIRGPEK